MSVFQVLLPVDGSPCALRAVEHVIRFARAGGRVSVHLVHAHEEPFLYGELGIIVSAEQIADLQRKHSDAVLEPAEKLLRAAKIPCQREILVGPIAERIAKRAEELGCDAIVMGTRGMGSIGNLLMGSVSTKIVHLATVPVTLVK
jgi:nucleotide-binding universal stress UspA family protein